MDPLVLPTAVVAALALCMPALVKVWEWFTAYRSARKSEQYDNRVQMSKEFMDLINALQNESVRLRQTCAETDERMARLQTEMNALEVLCGTLQDEVQHLKRLGAQRERLIGGLVSEVTRLGGKIPEGV